MHGINNIVQVINELANCINESGQIYKFTLCGERSYTTYKINSWLVTVKRDLKNNAYAVEIHLKKAINLSDLEA